MTVEYVNPDTLLKSRAFSQAVVVSNPAKTVYIGAQSPQDLSGSLVGRGDLREQTAQVLANLRAALEACGAGVEHMTQWTIYLVAGQPIQPAVEVAIPWLGDRPSPPLNTVLFVSGFPMPDMLISIEAIAIIP